MTIEKSKIESVITHFSDQNGTNGYAFFVDQRRTAVRIANKLRQKGFKCELTSTDYCSLRLTEVLVKRN